MSLTYRELQKMVKNETARGVEDGIFDLMIKLVETLMETGGSRLSPGEGVVNISPLRVGFMEKSLMIEEGKNYFEMGDDFLEAKGIMGNIDYVFTRLTQAQASAYANKPVGGYFFYEQGRRINFLFPESENPVDLRISYWGKIPHLTRENEDTHDIFGSMSHLYLSGVTAQILHRHRSYSDSFSKWEQFGKDIMNANQTYGEDAVDNVGQYQSPMIPLGV